MLLTKQSKSVFRSRFIELSGNGLQIKYFAKPRFCVIMTSYFRCQNWANDSNVNAILKTWLFTWDVVKGGIFSVQFALRRTVYEIQAKWDLAKKTKRKKRNEKNETKEAKRNKRNGKSETEKTKWDVSEFHRRLWYWKIWCIWKTVFMIISITNTCWLMNTSPAFAFFATILSQYIDNIGKLL